MEIALRLPEAVAVSDQEGLGAGGTALGRHRPSPPGACMCAGSVTPPVKSVTVRVRPPEYKPPPRTTYTDLGWIFAALTGPATLLAVWIYCAVTYGFFLGFGLGWIPALTCGCFQRSNLNMHPRAKNSFASG